MEVVLDCDISLEVVVITIVEVGVVVVVSQLKVVVELIVTLRSENKRPPIKTAFARQSANSAEMPPPTQRIRRRKILCI